jgi:hypothetical protein
MLSFIKKLFGGEDAESKEARLRMAADLQDPRRAFVWGVLAISYDKDPGYLKSHATEAIRDWYGVSSAADLRSYTAEDFGTRSHPAYNQFRLCFVARAGYGAGLLDEATSWSWAIQEAAVAQRHYRSWDEYAQGYIAGHLEYRASQGDPPERLEEIRRNISGDITKVHRTVWTAIPFHTPLG